MSVRLLIPLLSWAVVLIGAAASALAAIPADVELVGRGTFRSDRSDRSGLRGKLADGTPANRIGAIGSAIAYTGQGNRYAMLPDRGPNATQFDSSIDNSTRYQSRVELFDIRVDPATRRVHVQLAGTRLFSDEQGVPLSGLSSDFVAGQPSNYAGSHRFDPEGLRVSNDAQQYFVADEYGPSICSFDARSGMRLRTFELPGKFAVEHPAARAIDELARNSAGRQANRGLEGLAITPDGKTLVAILQSPLLQDGALHGGRRVGVNVRLLSVEIASGRTTEHLYQLSNGRKHGVNEIVAVNEHQFLVHERDNDSGSAAAFKAIFLVDLQGATEISQIAALPSAGLPEGARPVSKTLIIDLLDPRFGVVESGLPAKIEGLAFGPDLADGRHLLIVTSDNDFIATEATSFMAFAIAPRALPTYDAQHFERAAERP